MHAFLCVCARVSEKERESEREAFTTTLKKLTVLKYTCMFMVTYAYVVFMQIPILDVLNHINLIS